MECVLIQISGLPSGIMSSSGSWVASYVYIHVHVHIYMYTCTSIYNIDNTSNVHLYDWFLTIANCLMAWNMVMLYGSI